MSALMLLPKRMVRSRVGVLLLIVLPLLIVHRVLSSHHTAPGRSWVPKVPTTIMGVGMLPAARKPPHGTTTHRKQAVIVPPRKRPSTFKKPDLDRLAEQYHDADLTLDSLVMDSGYLGHATPPARVPISTNPNGPQHTFLPSGLLVPNPEGQHPIFDLVARSRAAWQDKVGKASTTLQEAVDEYRRRYNRAPPKGFDRWWKWCEEHNVQLPDEYDQINNDLEPFFALTPAQLQDLRAAAAQKEGMFTIKCGKTEADRRHHCWYIINQKGLNDEGKLVALQRAEGQLDLIRGIEDVLEDVEAVFYSHDVPWQFVGHDYKGSLEEAASVGEYYKDEETFRDLDKTHLGWASACAPHKPLRELKEDHLPDLEGLWKAPKSFVWDHKAVMDPCTNPDLVHLMGFLSAFGKGPGPSFEMFPVMAMCKTFLHSDVLGVSAEAWTEDVGDDPEWEDKPDNRLLWRGKTTGIYFKDGIPWNISQRINLVDHGDRSTGTLPITRITKMDEAAGQPEDRKWTELNEALMDIAFVDEPIQCDEKVCNILKEDYRFAERKDWSQSNRYKYLIDIDGNGWSARFKRLMSTNSLVLKSTIFPEWYTDRIQPWVHYVPLKPDLTDLYDVMSFFHGGNDALAKEIAMTGKHWSKTFWRREDMAAYQFRLLLEMARLMAPDRNAASYQSRE